MKFYRRKHIVAANWKMNVLPSDALSLAAEIYDQDAYPVELILFPAFTHIALLKGRINPALLLGGQDCSPWDHGPYTGQISAKMLHDLGCKYVLLGHSEVRQSNPNVNDELPAKIERALAAGLDVVYCCGEHLDHREENVHLAFVFEQLSRHIFVQGDISRFVIAYEPIWAIGTGVTASPQQAQEMHAFIRQGIRDHFGEQAALDVRILYGGSVKGDNAGLLAAMPDIDGVLVGGASLVAAEMRTIIRSF